MKRLTFFFTLLFCSTLFSNQNSWIRINQLGYTENSIKTAIMISKLDYQPSEYVIRDAIDDSIVFRADRISPFGKYLSFESTFRIDFSNFSKPGTYYIQIDSVKSTLFRISNTVYNGTADYLLNYMRQQRCGFNPFLNDSCHTQDGYIIYNHEKDSVHINVTGGWHDASDYLQYVTTSANAVYQMLFAYEQNPKAFADKYNADGLPGSNGIPDILDEAKWGLDWLDKMNPSKNEMYNQIADDRDHMGFRLPTEDSISYGKGLERPVYFCTGKPQGVMKYKNRADGIASTAAKFASSFALGSELLKNYYPEFAEKIRDKSLDAYQFAKDNPGVCQTAPCRAPYFYEEDNYADDMELAAATLYQLNSDTAFQTDAKVFAEMEPVTPWMGADTARHYQWYPFVNLGHYLLASDPKNELNEEAIALMKKGLENIYQRSISNPFMIGIPFIWCSNNLVAALLTQARLYHELTGDGRYLEMEAAARDWLFGCNPWGTSMIVGLPSFGDYPSDPHSAFWHLNNYQTFGGLVDGPVYASIYNRLLGITLYSGDEYSDFQSDYVVYHDDYGDYSTNEPTMDGTASLTYYLSSLESSGARNNNNYIYSYGAVIRKDTTKKEISLVFTGHEFADGAETIIDELAKRNIRASFFFTGDFYRNDNFKNIIRKLINNGHYLGAHSDKHLLYADWVKRDSLLITKDEFQQDLKRNYAQMSEFGIKHEDAPIFLPPYEWYNQTISDWCNELGLHIYNFTQGTSSNADYTIPSMNKQYKSSDEIFKYILEYEKENNLNGFILLMHIGTHPDRTDKFYNRLGLLLDRLTDMGYKFTRIDE